MDAETIYRRRWATLGVLSLSLVIIGLDNTILNVALPTLVRELGASQSQLQWIVDAYILVFAGLLLTMGALGDRYGRKLALTVGLVMFGLSSVAAAFADSANTLIAARALMGIGGALIMPATLSIITNVFSGPERGRAIAAWAAVAGLGIVLGPVLGGWLLEKAPLRLVVRQVDRLPVGNIRLVDPAETMQHLGAGGMKKVVPAQIEGIELRDGCGCAMDLGNRNRPVESEHRSRRDLH